MAKNFDISIAGELNLDLILYGLPASMPTERELLGTDFRATLGSSSAIVAHNAATLGARVAFTTLIGPDEFGELALGRLRNAGVDVSRTRRRKSLSTGITLLLPHGNERHILTYPGTIAELTVADLDVDFLIQSRHFHLSSLYLQRGLHEGLSDLLGRLKEAGLTISLDTNDDPDDRWGPPLLDVLRYVDIFLPNEDEICRMTNLSRLDDALQALPVKPPTIVVKRGSKGARVYEHGQATDVAPLTVVPKDTIGAGDSFDAGFLYAFLSNLDIVTCAHCGNITGALSTQASGGTEAFCDSALRDSFLKKHQWAELFKNVASQI
jgi:sugar/nucleoside kinase (ribokinase family)